MNRKKGIDTKCHDAYFTVVLVKASLKTRIILKKSIGSTEKDLNKSKENFYYTCNCTPGYFLNCLWLFMDQVSKFCAVFLQTFTNCLSLSKSRVRRPRAILYAISCSQFNSAKFIFCSD